jgi:hypothetical protein
MKTKDGLKLSGQVRLVCYDKNGNLKWDTGFLKNTITNAGLAILPNLAGGLSADPFTYLALGTDSTAENAAHTTLQAEITDSGLERASATVTRVTTTVTNDTLQLYKQWEVTGTKDVEEVGVFNASSGGTMLGRKLTTTQSVVDGDRLRATYKIKFS